MAEIALWNNHSFVVSPSLIRGFSDLTIKAGSSTNDKTSSSQTYVTRKNGNAYELSMTVGLSELTGCDVRNEAMTLLEEARTGKSDYFYIAGVKIVTCMLMLTSADVEEVEMNASGTWISCKVKLTFKQSSKMDSTVSTSTTTKKSSSSSSSKKSSSSSSNSKNSKTTGSYATMNASQLTVNKSTTKQDTASNAAKAKAATKAASTSSKTTTVKKASSSGKATTTAKKSTATASNKTTTTKSSGGYYAPTGNPFF